MARCSATPARGNLTTALGVLQYAGLTSVVVAGALSSLPIPGGWITILTSYGHLVVRYPDSTVKTQTVGQRIGSGWLADLYYASTPWEVATRALGAASPAAYPRCKGG